MRYAHDHALFHKHVHGVTLDPYQVIKCIEMDGHSNTIDVSCRRTGKTAIKELYCLKHLATNPAQEEGIGAPRRQSPSFLSRRSFSPERNRFHFPGCST